MADVMELLDHIRREQDNFPAAQKKVAAFVVENYQQIAFLPISALSQRVGVSDNTVIKFCNHLGYEKNRKVKEPEEMQFQKENAFILMKLMREE